MAGCWLAPKPRSWRWFISGGAADARGSEQSGFGTAARGRAGHHRRRRGRITLALEFAGTAHKVLLVESGNLEADADTQALDEGAVIGMAYEPLESARARYFGGTTNMWTGWCKPLDAVDLRPRPALAISGWPIGSDELEPFYRRAQPMMDAGPYEYNLAYWRQAAGPVDDLTARGLEMTFWQKSPPVRFGSRYLEALRAATNVTVLLNANLTSMVTASDGAAIESVELRTLAGKSATARARIFVLACGGLENPRLLLCAAPSRPHGLGNDSDLVGRYFMEHPHWDIGTVYPTDAILPGGQVFPPCQRRPTATGRLLLHTGRARAAGRLELLRGARGAGLSGQRHHSRGQGLARHSARPVARPTSLYRTMANPWRHRRHFRERLAQVLASTGR